MAQTVIAGKQVHERWERYWRDRHAKQGTACVGRQGEDQGAQGARLEGLLRQRFTPDQFYPNALDFGCGWGRFLPLLSGYSGHLWAVDIVPALSNAGQVTLDHVTPLTLGWPFKIPAQQPFVDLMLCSLVLQHIVEPERFEVTTAELKRVLKPGARVLIVDNAQDKAPHVQWRAPEVLAGALGLQPGYFVERVTINKRPNDHWLIDGLRAG